MLNGWQEVSIGDAFDLVNGYAFKSADFVSQGTPVVKIKNVKAGYFSDHEFSYVDSSFLKRKADKVIEYNDLLISMSGNRHDGSPETWVGKVAPFRKKPSHLLNQRVGALRLREHDLFDVRFAGYCFSAWPLQQHFIAVATSSGGQANLSPRQILSTKVRVPPLSHQKAIAKVLGALDDKIELNRQMNETLEATARAVFKSWFVDFDPVRTKIDGRQPHGMNAETAALFPDRFEHVDGELVPAGWVLGNLADVGERVRVNRKPDEIDSECPYVGLSDFDSKKLSLSKWGVGAEVSSTKAAFQSGHILFGRLRAYFHNVAIAPITGVCSTDVLVVKAKEPCWHAFAALLLSEDETITFADAHSTGTRMPRVSWGDLASLPTVLPPRELVSRFEQFAGPMLKMLTDQVHESQTLAELRDTLLPKLLSGELSVPAAKANEEAV